MYIGSGVAMSATMSHSPCSITESISSPTLRRRYGSWSATRRRLNPGLTMRRRRVCSGGSKLIIDGTELSGREPLPEQNVCQSRLIRVTSACDAAPQMPMLSSQYIGALARIHAVSSSKSA